LAVPAYAITPQVSITSLPEYVTVDYFKLSCSAIGGSTAQFSFKKEGGSYSNFGALIDLTTSQCLVDVTSAQIDSQAKYFFRVVLNSGQESVTSTTYDVSGPSAVRDYGKEKIGNTTYRIRWTNPGESDFAQVVIYRGEASDISANDSTKIAQVGGAPDAQKEYIDNGVSPDKTYYYIIRALDKAGNSSSLVGDTTTTTVLGTSTTTSGGQGGTEGTVRVLPTEEEPQGEVLKESTEQAPVEEVGPVKQAVDEAVTRISTNRTLTWAAIAAFALGLLSFFFFRRRNR
jgi:hypothetical protein